MPETRSHGPPASLAPAAAAGDALSRKRRETSGRSKIRRLARAGPRRLRRGPPRALLRRQCGRRAPAGLHAPAARRRDALARRRRRYQARRGRSDARASVRDDGPVVQGRGRNLRRPRPAGPRAGRRGRGREHAHPRAMHRGAGPRRGAAHFGADDPGGVASSPRGPVPTRLRVHRGGPRVPELGRRRVPRGAGADGRGRKRTGAPARRQAPRAGRGRDPDGRGARRRRRARGRDPDERRPPLRRAPRVVDVLFTCQGAGALRGPRRRGGARRRVRPVRLERNYGRRRPVDGARGAGLTSRSGGLLAPRLFVHARGGRRAAGGPRGGEGLSGHRRRRVGDAASDEGGRR